MAEDQEDLRGENPLSAVRNARTYRVSDESAAGGKRDVERDELAKGYEYGRTAVHISESDENITKLETKAALEVIGFIQDDQVCSLLIVHTGKSLFLTNEIFSTIDICT
jgi:ATP-dependent DNA helicase 2 subunit 2